MSSFVQLPYGLLKTSKKIECHLPKDYEEAQYIKRLPYIQNKDLHYSHSIIDLLKDGDDFKKFLLATSKYWKSYKKILMLLLDQLKSLQCNC